MVEKTYADLQRDATNARRLLRGWLYGVLVVYTSFISIGVVPAMYRTYTSPERLEQNKRAQGKERCWVGEEEHCIIRIRHKPRKDVQLNYTLPVVDRSTYTNKNSDETRGDFCWNNDLEFRIEGSTPAENIDLGSTLPL